VEEVVKRVSPLIAQTGRHDDQDPACQTAGEQLRQDQPRLDGFAGAYGVRDEQPGALCPKAEQQGDQLVVSRNSA
jgi:hypothetical protein